MYLHCHPDNGLRSQQNLSTVLLPSRIPDKKSLAGMFGRSFWPRNVTRGSRLLEIRNGIICEFVDRLLRICGKFNRQGERERCKFKDADLLNILLVIEQSLHWRTRRTLRNLFFSPTRKRKRKEKKSTRLSFPRSSG